MREQRETFFLPAETPGEATARIHSLTGSSDPRTRGEKRALLALRDALGLDIEVAKTNAKTGALLADALGLEWLPREHQIRNMVTLEGLNALLRAATEAYSLGALKKAENQRPPSLSGPEWATFMPAQSKIEAVNRISQLTDSGPEDLGPGSKERKRVLVNLARALTPRVDVTLTKTKLGAAISRELGAPWTAMCESTGETISLVGLNTLLAGAERQLGRLGAPLTETLGTPEAEGAALAAALVDKLDRKTWDGRETIQRMRRGGIPGHNMSEWQGWYFEGRGREILNATFPPRKIPIRSRYGNTSFDYTLNYVWDLKAHTESWHNAETGEIEKGLASTQLNDERAIRACIEEQGLGFLILGGAAVVDLNQDFARWHAEFKGRTKPQRRRVKAGFTPLHLEAFWVPNTDALNASLASGALRVAAQGAQQDGSPRQPKMHMHQARARRELRVAIVSP